MSPNRNNTKCPISVETDRMMTFLADYTKNAEFPLHMSSLWKEYKTRYETHRKVDTLRKLFSEKLAPNIWKTETLDDQTKIEISFATSTPINLQYLKIIQDQGEVKIDKEGRILKYNAKNGSLKLNALKKKESGQNRVENTETDTEISDKESVDLNDDPMKKRKPNVNEDNEIINFFIGMAKDSSLPLNVRTLCKHYKDAKNSLKQVDTLYRRFKRVLAPNLYDLANCDMKTKIRLFFMTNTPVDGSVLKRLSKNAIVVVDNQNRIVEYRSNEKDGLKLKIKPPKPYGTTKNITTLRTIMTDAHADVTREDGALMKFLIKRALQANAPLCKGQMCEEYKKATGSKVPERDLRKRFVTILAPKIGNINNYDVAELAKLYFVTSTPVNEKFLKRLREHNIVELDNEKRIIKLVGKKIKFEGVHSFADKVDRYKEYRAKTGNCIEYRKEGCSPVATSARNIGSEFVATEHIDTDPKTKALSAPTNSQSGKDRSSKKEKHRKRRKKSSSDKETESIECLSAIVAIKSENSEDSALSEYKVSSDSNSGDDSNDSQNSMNFEIFRYLAIKANNVQQPLELSTLWRDFVLETKANSSPSEVESRFQQRLAPKIHCLKEFDLETRVRMLFASSTPVENKFLKELKKDAVVELDNNDRIIKYKSNKTGGLKLGAGEIIGSKMKKRRRRVFEESEDSDDDFFPSGITHEKKSEGGKKKRKVIVYLSSDEDTGLDEIEEKSKSSSQTQNLTSSSIHDVKSEVVADIAPDASEIPSETRFDQELYITDNKATLETQVSLGTTMPTDLYTIEETPINEQRNAVSTESNMPLQIVPVTEQPIFPISNNEIELSNIFLGSPAFSSYYQGGIPSRPPSQIDYFGSEMFSMQSMSSLPQFDLTPSPMNQLSLYSPPFLESTSLPMFSNPGPESITLKDCLKLLKILVISLETPLLHCLSEQIKQTIEKIGDDDEKLLMSDVLPVAKAAFFGLSRKFRAHTSEDHPNMTKNVKEFSKIFKCFLLGLESPSLDELLNEVRKISDNTEPNDQIVMISDIQQAIQSILSTFSR